MNIRDIDVVFLSFDEPRADEFWQDLRLKCGWARRVHGIKGFDRAHKEAALAATTDRLVTIDGECLVDPAFFEIDVDDALLTPQTVVSWPSRNHVNGLVYGNGSIKCWPRSHVLAMRTHENAPSAERSVDFPYSSDWNSNAAVQHISEAVPYAEVYGNGSPQHAFRTGFRQGVRLALADGRRALRYGRVYHLTPRARHWLQMWLSVGADAENGLWCIYGARLGCWKVSFEDWDYVAINDYDWLDQYWRASIAPRFAPGEQVCGRTGYCWNDTALTEACAELGAELRARANVFIADLSPAQSAFLKSITPKTPVGLNSLDRMGTMFWRGVGVERDTTRAVDYYAIAAGAGQTNAMNSLARACHTGSGRPRNYRRAVELWREASARANPFAAYELGDLYRRGWGWGVDKDSGRAKDLFRLAADRGHLPAHAKLAEMYLTGDSGRVDQRRALFHLTFASLDNPASREEAMRLLGELNPTSGAGRSD